METQTILSAVLSLLPTLPFYRQHCRYRCLWRCHSIVTWLKLYPTQFFILSTLGIISIQLTQSSSLETSTSFIGSKICRVTGKTTRRDQRLDQFTYQRISDCRRYSSDGLFFSWANDPSCMQPTINNHEQYQHHPCSRWSSRRKTNTSMAVILGTYNNYY